MDNNEKRRVIHLPTKLWDAIDQEARRCRRSSVKQVEAILLSYYQMENVDLKSGAFSRHRLENNQIERDKDK